MSDTEQQSFQAWLRGHFTFDSHDLAEITNFIAVPGLPDVDMPDMLSLLAGEEGVQQPSSSHGWYPQSPTSIDSTAAVTNSSMLWPTGQAGRAAPQQPTAGGPPAGDADVTALADLRNGFQLQEQAQQAGLYSSEQQLPVPPSQLGWPSSGNVDALQPNFQTQGHHTKHTSQPMAGKRSTGIQGASRRVNAAATAGASVQEGSVKKRKRKISDAQRAAHRRFRQRRREQLATLEQEVEAKQAQLQALSLEHMALRAKARALDQLVASAGDGMAVLQQLEQLSISQMQPHSVREGLQGSQQQQQSSVSTEDDQQSALSPVVTTGADGDHVSSTVGLQLQQAQSPTSDPATSDPSSPGSRQEQQLEQEQLVGAHSNRGSGNKTCGGICTTGMTAGSLQDQLQSPASRAGTAGSIEYLEARLKTLLAMPTHDPVSFLHEDDSMRVQDELPKLKTLVKSIVREVTQLLHQLGQETGQGSAIGLQAAPGTDVESSAQQRWQQATVSAPGSLLQQPALGSHQASAAVATGSGDNVSASPAYARLQTLLAQTAMEFRKFVSVNRLSLYHFHTLNLETGSLGVPPPAGHWKRVALMLKDKLPQQVLSDVCVARQLYSNAVSSITRQRHMLIMKLQRLLERDDGVYRTLQVIVDLHGLHGEGAAILDAIDHNMRKELALSGVYQFMVQKLMSPISSAELLVHSYPYVPDLNCIFGEIVQVTEQVPALTALQELQLQQLNSMGGGDQQQPTQIRTSVYDIDQQQSFVAQTGQLQQQQRPGRSLHQQEIPAAVMQQFQTQTDATWQGQQAPLQQLPVEPWQHVQQQQQPSLDWLEQLPAVSM